MYKAFHNHLPHNIQRLFARSQQNRTRQNALNLKVSRKSTKIQNLKPSIFGPYVWNQLNASVREKNSIHLFKSHLKKLVFSGYWHVFLRLCINDYMELHLPAWSGSADCLSWSASSAASVLSGWLGGFQWSVCTLLP